MPVFVRWLAPLVTMFLLSVLLKAPEKIVMVTFLLCITGLVGMIIRAIIIAKDTPGLKDHMRKRGKKDYWQ